MYGFTGLSSVYRQTVSSVYRQTVSRLKEQNFLFLLLMVEHKNRGSI
jgi:hypothetical protein